MVTKFFLLLVLGKRKVKKIILSPYWKIKTTFLFKAYGIKYSSFVTKGTPYISVNKSGVFQLGSNFIMNNGYEGNIIGRQQRCIFVVSNGILTIGENVGVSSIAIFCKNRISIGNNVLIGGNTVFYDTDFHSLNYFDRIQVPENKEHVKTKPIVIGDNVFIGGHTTILKGVNIGNNAIIGAGSVVTSNVPANEIWAGNPAKKIRIIF